MKKAIIETVHGNIVIELFEQEAPKTVANFEKLINEKFYDFYCYDNNEDLIMKLCKKFNISYPNVRYNCFGQTDVTFIQGLYEYLVELDIKNENFIIKRKNNKSNGYKSNKNYMATVKTIKTGGWYQVIKWIAKNSEI